MPLCVYYIEVATAVVSYIGNVYTVLTLVHAHIVPLCMYYIEVAHKHKVLYMPEGVNSLQDKGLSLMYINFVILVYTNCDPVVKQFSS